MKCLRLYHYPVSRSTRVLWTIKELGLEVELVRVDLMQLEHRTPEFAAVNPNMAVPVLEWEEEETGQRQRMFESAAIVRLLAERHGRRLMPQRVADWALFEQTYAWAAVTLDTLLWTVRVVHDFRDGADKEMLEMQCAKWNDSVAPQLEAICGNDFACGAEFTIADILLTYQIFWAEKYRRLKLLTIGPKALAYYKRMAARPAYIAATRDKSEFQAAKL
jgi:glutathione S-transferase